jgi:hypothetical protein
MRCATTSIDVPLVFAAAEGLDDVIQQLLPLIDPSSGGVGCLLLHGIGGAGKSTLAHQLAVQLQDQQLFPGGVYKVTVQPEVLDKADVQTLMKAQESVLQQLTGRAPPHIGSLLDGASAIRRALKGCSGGLLLVIDNVPEDEGGIDGLLPYPVADCMPPG